MLRYEASILQKMNMDSFFVIAQNDKNLNYHFGNGQLLPFQKQSFINQNLIIFTAF